LHKFSAGSEILHTSCAKYGWNCGIGYLWGFGESRVFFSFLHNHLASLHLDSILHLLLLWIRPRSWILSPWIAVWLLWTTVQSTMMRISDRLLKMNVVCVRVHLSSHASIIDCSTDRYKAHLPATILTQP
jgi:hypothetical protein